MEKEKFIEFTNQAKWIFAKSIPNWPHFYIVEEELPDKAAFKGAKQFIKNGGYDGKFFDMEVRYFDADGWTYWASPLAKPFEEQYMINRCKMEFTYESLAKTEELPEEGFEGSDLSLSAILEDPEFKGLVQVARGGGFNVFNVMGTADYEIRHSSVLSWLFDQNANHNKGSVFLELFWEQLSTVQSLPNLSFHEYGVHREGGDEDEQIDILLKSNDGKWVIVIENKLFSPETGDQLDRYFNYIERQYADVPNRVYFYLTPDGIAPKRKEDAEKWIPINYIEIKQTVTRFLEETLPDRVEDFLEQYLEHLDRNVLRSLATTERQRAVLRRHTKTFHALEFMLDEESVQSQCGDVEINLVKSIVAVQQEVERELFEFTKLQMAKHGYVRYSGLGHWITIKIPGLQEKLIQSGWLNEKDPMPIVFAFDSSPHLFRAEVWLYKNKPLFYRTKSQLGRFSREAPDPNRGDEHLVERLFLRTIIQPEQIIRDSLDELKMTMATYFESQLKSDLKESLLQIGKMIDSIPKEEK